MHGRKRHSSDDPVLKIASKAITWESFELPVWCCVVSFFSLQSYQSYFCTTFGESYAQTVVDVPKLLNSNV